MRKNLCKIKAMAAAAKERKDLILCSKCGKNPRADQDGTNPWCLECRAEYQRSYNGLKIEMSESRGFCAGVTAMRHQVIAFFSQWPSAHFSGTEIAVKVQQMPGPGDLQKP